MLLSFRRDIGDVLIQIHSNSIPIGENHHFELENDSGCLANSSVDLINRINFFVNDKSDKAGLEKPPDGIRRPALFEASVPQAQGIQNHKTGHPDRIHER